MLSPSDVRKLGLPLCAQRFYFRVQRLHCVLCAVYLLCRLHLCITFSDFSRIYRLPLASRESLGLFFFGSSCSLRFCFSLSLHCCLHLGSVGCVWALSTIESTNFHCPLRFHCPLSSHCSLRFHCSLRVYFSLRRLLSHSGAVYWRC